MVLTGSVGLAGLASAAGGAAEINDLTPHELAGLEEYDGMGLFAAEVNARGVDCSDAAAVMEPLLTTAISASNCRMRGVLRCAMSECDAKFLRVP